MKFICEIDVMSLLLLQNSQTHCLINPYCKELSISWNQSNHLLGLLLHTIMYKRTVTGFNPFLIKICFDMTEVIDHD